VGEEFGMESGPPGPTEFADCAIVIGAKPWHPARSHRPAALEAKRKLNAARPTLRFIACPPGLATISMQNAVPPTRLESP
jgi:hypothetical protein